MVEETSLYTNSYSNEPMYSIIVFGYLSEVLKKSCPSNILSAILVFWAVLYKQVWGASSMASLITKQLGDSSANFSLCVQPVSNGTNIFCCGIPTV